MGKAPLVLCLTFGFVLGMLWNTGKERVTLMKLERHLANQQNKIELLASDQEKLKNTISDRDELVKNFCNKYPATKPKNKPITAAKPVKPKPARTPAALARKSETEL